MKNSYDENIEADEIMDMVADSLKKLMTDLEVLNTTDSSKMRILNACTAQGMVISCIFNALTEYVRQGYMTHSSLDGIAKVINNVCTDAELPFQIKVAPTLSLTAGELSETRH